MALSPCKSVIFSCVENRTEGKPAGGLNWRLPETEDETLSSDIEQSLGHNGRSARGCIHRMK